MEFTSEFYYNPQSTPEKRLSDAKNGDNFVIEDLLNFPNDDTVVVGDEAAITGTSTNSSPIDTSSAEPPLLHHPPDITGPRTSGQFSSELCVPYDDVAELEWLSNFVEESFSSEDLQKLQLIQGMKAQAQARTDQPETRQHHHFQPEPARPGPILRPEVPVPAKARSKRSRAAPGNWTSRLLAVAPPPATSSSSETAAAKHRIKKEAPPENCSGGGGGGEGRRCLHCATDKTPQWRTGPMGPKTLCNACGVRYKSGRLVPEYRPAASPTFVLTKHSNSHRKVLELRRQKEQMRAQQHHQFLHHHHHHHQGVMFDVSNGEDYLIHQHIGPDYRQLI